MSRSASRRGWLRVVSPRPNEEAVLTVFVSSRLGTQGSLR